MSSEETKILQFNQCKKVDESKVIYADLECLIEKFDWFKNLPEHSSITKVSNHISSDFSMCTIPSFKSIEIKAWCIQS